MVVESTVTWGRGQQRFGDQRTSKKLEFIFLGCWTFLEYFTQSSFSKYVMSDPSRACRMEPLKYALGVAHTPAEVSRTVFYELRRA